MNNSLSPPQLVVTVTTHRHHCCLLSTRPLTVTTTHCHYPLTVLHRHSPVTTTTHCHHMQSLCHHSLSSPQLKVSTTTRSPLTHLSHHHSLTCLLSELPLTVIATHCHYTTDRPELPLTVTTAAYCPHHHSLIVTTIHSLTVRTVTTHTYDPHHHHHSHSLSPPPLTVTTPTHCHHQKSLSARPLTATTGVTTTRSQVCHHSLTCRCHHRSPVHVHSLHYHGHPPVDGGDNSTCCDRDSGCDSGGQWW